MNLLGTTLFVIAGLTTVVALIYAPYVAFFVPDTNEEKHQAIGTARIVLCVFGASVAILINDHIMGVKGSQFDELFFVVMTGPIAAMLYLIFRLARRFVFHPSARAKKRSLTQRKVRFLVVFMLAFWAVSFIALWR